ncbi:MAG TPA: DNA/RNA non-specific endonuclease [Lysobacter sp.]
MDSGDLTLLRLRRFNESVRRSDPGLAQESRDLEGRDQDTVSRRRAEAIGLEAVSAGPDARDDIMLESIILRRERPVLAIKNDRVELTFQEQEDSAIWKERLVKAEPLLAGPIRGIGRIELVGGRLEWVGTGWLIDDEILVTNRHVASEFAMRRGAGLEFRVGPAGRISASTDFRKEIDGVDDGSVTFQLARPLHIEDEPGPDLAFFEVRRENGNGTLAKPLACAKRARATAHAATIGYPAFDSRIPDRALMERLYGGVYDRKRFAPGAVTKVDGTRLLHNCTTLGGASGSPALDLETGEVIGLHFSGSFLSTNHAVCIEVVNKALRDMRTSRSRTRPPPRRSRPFEYRAADSSRDGASGAASSFTVPLTITVTLGAPAPAAVRPAKPARQAPVSAPPDETEARREDYEDREGYRADFLGDGFEVPLPSVMDEDDVLPVEGTDDNVLRYEHFSVVMSASRRMCHFSAVNIDGALAKKSKRVDWKWDPRIPREQQIKEECYGDPPKFSRGHMTRREDPGWGERLPEAQRGNQDSMHVTNATPQMQAFNSPIWLALEDYALDNAKQDDMRICVFTGPYFSDDDPVRYGVRIPVGFWKVIAFIHDETGELCATGYEMHQENQLMDEEFVFDQFVSPQTNLAAQVSIRHIQDRAGVDFGVLAEVDPLASEEESVAAAVPLVALEQIRFL